MLGGEFLKYMEAFKPFLGIGLKNYAEYQVGYTFQNIADLWTAQDYLYADFIYWNFFMEIWATVWKNSQTWIT